MEPVEDSKLYRYAMAMAIHILRVIHYGEQQDLAAAGGFAPLPHPAGAAPGGSSAVDTGFFVLFRKRY